MIKVSNGRGANRASLKDKNIKAVEAYFKANPGKTMAECSRVIGLSAVTVSKHVKFLTGRS